MEFRRFSEKQARVLTWWCDSSSERGRDAIICDGAVRSGKTICMGISFFLWAMRRFDGQRLALCGKSIGALRRNLLEELLPNLELLGLACVERRGENKITVRFGGRENCFYLFGAGDESSAGRIQGMTLAGVLFDEAALMPRSFAEQACARCSVQGSKLWFNCNPEGPQHWFYRDWILRREEKNALYLHFSMEDNPSLTPEIRARYESLYSGAFYRRFVRGEWASAQGRVYDFFDTQRDAGEVPREPMERYCISCDYGTVNPASFGLWGKAGDIWYRIQEFYYDSRREGRQRTDGEYAGDLIALAGGREIEFVVVDPSAASFIERLRREGFAVIKAENEVLGGIRVTAELLRSGRLVICNTCADALREMELYSWDENHEGGDRVRKEHDHAMDEIRYFACTVAVQGERDGFSAGHVERGSASFFA